MITRCSLCGSTNLEKGSYLKFAENKNLLRKIVYHLPNYLVRIGKSISDYFSTLYCRVEVNKQYFSLRNIVYCNQCFTGCTDPLFSEAELDQYYHEFYWKNRNIHDDEFTTDMLEVSENSQKVAKERLSWIKKWGLTFTSVIDFGGGDCAAAELFNSLGAVVYVVDKSQQTEHISKSMGIDYYSSLADAPNVDFIFSAHSIEHVHDLEFVFTQILQKMNKGGFVFFETPNIADFDTLNSMTHTPHTYMLSQATFKYLVSKYSCELVAAEEVGPSWGDGLNNNIKHHADLRVLLKKT